MKTNFIVDFHNWIDGKIKFPNLNEGDIGIQIGFDLSSPNLTSDLWIMSHKVGKTGMAIGIDPDPSNHQNIKPFLEKKGLKTTLIQKGTYSEKTNTKLYLAAKASWNAVDQFIDSVLMAKKTDREIAVELDTLDNIVTDLNVDIGRIGHINITNNKAEYSTLLGMTNILEKSTNLSMTVIAGRTSKEGFNDAEIDYEVIEKLLQKHGFDTKFYYMQNLFWWAGVHQLLMKQKWVYNRKTFGIIMANKGSRQRKWYQSFS